ncbi:AbiH family protein [Flavobacterium panacagri]|uniref:AbiH family protein n=1 Tax=Flavobacterium panacagri TaxID=3034146 RepID=UPI0025A50625|nr:AbiH family protein [Flavobacterium panacagri]
MPKILITGNGFDLNIGLPTSYNDFIKILRHIEKNNDYSFESIFSNSSNYNQISKNYTPFNIDQIELNKLKTTLEHNLWFQFFKDEFEIETWIDFETKIEYVLKILFSSVNYLKKNIFSKGSLPNNDMTYEMKLFNNDIEIIQVLNRFKIIEFDGYYYIKLNSNFLINKYDHFIDIDLDKITKNLNQQLIEFKLIFNYYFEVFVFPLYQNLNIKIEKKLFSNIDKHYTFNYTPTFERIYNKGNITSFLHGKINSKENQIVLGINEIPLDENIDKKFFLPFTKYFQKLNSNTDYVFIKEYEKEKQENYLFFFWGHSLDKSDEDYINEVFDFVINLKSKTKKIIVIHHNETSKSRLLINLLNIRGKKDIQELMRSKTLIFTDINGEELKRELNLNIKREIKTTVIPY